MHIEVQRQTGDLFVIIYDDDVAEEVNEHKWHVHLNPVGLAYARTNIRKPDGLRATLLMHTLVTGWDFVDHIDHNGLNNSRDNLRRSNKSLNAINGRPHRDGSSQYKGVRWHNRDGIWEANIKISGKQRYIGRFADEVDAARAYDIAAYKEFGPFAGLNFVGGMGSSGS